VKTLLALSSAFAKKDFPARPSDRFASTWTNVDRMECATMANVSTWMDRSNASAIPDTNYHQMERLA
jgi:hypothetical protein